MTNFVGRLGVTLGLNSAEFTRGIEAASKKLEQFSDAVGTYGKVAAAALAAAGAAALRYADEISDTAQANDVAIASILQLSNALANNGGKAENAGKLLASFTAAIDKAAEGSFETQKVLGKLGVSFKDLGTLSIDELFRKTVEGLAEMPDSVTRGAKAFELFGKAAKGVDFVGLNEEMKTSNKISEEQAKKIKEAADAYDLLAKVARDVTTILATELGPPLKATVDYIKTIKSETEVMGTALKTVFQTIAVLGANVAFVVEAIADEVSHTISNAKLLAKFDFKAAREANEAHWAKWEERRKQLDAFEAKIMGKGADTSTTMPSASQGANAGRTGGVVRQVKEALSPEEVARRKKATDDWARGYLETERQLEEGRAAISNQQTEDQKKYIAELEKGQELIRKQIALDLERQLKDKQEWAAYQGQLQQEEAALGKQLSQADEMIYRERVMLELSEKARGMKAHEAQLAQELIGIQFKYADAVQQINDREYLTTEAREKALTRQKELMEKEIELAKQRFNLAQKYQDATFGEGFANAIKTSTLNATNAFQMGQQAFQSVMGNMESAITRFVQTGKLSFKDLAKSIIADLIAIQLKAQATALFSGLLGRVFGAPSAYASATSYAATAPMGWLGFADGGDPPVNQPSIVGERGPELFVPKTAGTIVPNHQLASMMSSGQTVNYNGPVIQNMSAIDTQSGLEFLSRNKQAVWAANQSAQRSLPMNR